MLKKLAKYGNSTTLVIDKAILELLNMDESTIVKLRTDGRSLIITPSDADTNQKISYEGSEALAAAAESFNKIMPKVDKNSKDFQESYEKYCKVFREIFSKNKESFTNFHEVYKSDEFNSAMAELAERIDPVKHPEEYAKESRLIIAKLSPEVGKLYAAIDEVYSKNK